MYLIYMRLIFCKTVSYAKSMMRSLFYHCTLDTFLAMYGNILYFAWADQRDKVWFIFHKVQGCCMEKKHSYAVNLFIVFATQRIPEGDNCIFAYQHYTT